jgi:hypothetical protein
MVLRTVFHCNNLEKVHEKIPMLQEEGLTEDKLSSLGMVPNNRTWQAGGVAEQIYSQIGRTSPAQSVAEPKQTFLSDPEYFSSSLDPTLDSFKIGTFLKFEIKIIG